MSPQPYLLLQVRKPTDPMRAQEVRCFARALQCETDDIGVHDLISGPPKPAQWAATEMVLMGGSGDYSVAEGGPWLGAALEAMAELAHAGHPTFASCWGFQAMARALGGTVVTDLDRAELGTFTIELTATGQQDPVVGPLGPTFAAFEGHQDFVIELPPAAELLATTAGGVAQAFRLAGKPIYGTQFHPELSREDFLARVKQYPEYLERVLGVDTETFAATCTPTPVANTLLRRFRDHVRQLASSA